jgi:hypothetical protein
MSVPVMHGGDDIPASGLCCISQMGGKIIGVTIPDRMGMEFFN